ncbi:MAG TPA: IS630 family transposase [Solirubrobacteraceae bacterium]|nr:IS630 family transposase [Solirubrobacteraceae bacterium]
MFSADRDARSLSQDAQEALRVRAVKMVVEQGFSQVDAAGAVGVGERQMRRWMVRYRRGGWKALEKRARGRSSGEQMTLSDVQQQWLVDAICSKFPDQLRIPGLLWTRSAVQALILERCGVRLDVTTVGRYLRRWGFTLKRPVKRMHEADPVVVEAWLQDVYPAIKARAKKEGAMILWQDESGVRLQQLTPQAGYAPRGQRAVAKVSGKYIGVNMISALSNAGQLHFQLFEGKFTAQVFIDYLTRLIGDYEGRKIFLIADNHSTHHAKDVKAWAAQHTHEIELHFLPAYSPHLNPDEYLNQDVKRHIRALHERPASKPGLKDTLTRFLDGRAALPEIVRRYFDAPEVQYAR